MQSYHDPLKSTTALDDEPDEALRQFGEVYRILRAHGPVIAGSDRTHFEGVTIGLRRGVFAFARIIHQDESSIEGVLHLAGWSQRRCM